MTSAGRIYPLIMRGWKHNTAAPPFGTTSLSFIGHLLHSSIALFITPLPSPQRVTSGMSECPIQVSLFLSNHPFASLASLCSCRLLKQHFFPQYCPHARTLCGTIPLPSPPPHLAPTYFLCTLQSSNSAHFFHPCIFLPLWQVCPVAHTMQLFYWVVPCPLT